MIEPLSAAEIVRIISSAYLFSSVVILTGVCIGWWAIEKIEQSSHPSLKRFFS